MGEGLWGWDRKSYLGPAEIASFPSQDLGRSNNHGTFWHGYFEWIFRYVSIGYFYILFLWAMAVSDFLSLKVYKNLGPPLSSITFTVNSHADNLSINIFVSNIIQYEIRFFIKIYAKVFYIQIWFKCETPPLRFLIKAMV